MKACKENKPKKQNKKPLSVVGSIEIARVGFKNEQDSDGKDNSAKTVEIKVGSPRIAFSK